MVSNGSHLFVSTFFTLLNLIQECLYSVYAEAVIVVVVAVVVVVVAVVAIVAVVVFSI